MCWYHTWMGPTAANHSRGCLGRFDLIFGPEIQQFALIPECMTRHRRATRRKFCGRGSKCWWMIMCAFCRPGALTVTGDSHRWVTRVVHGECVVGHAQYVICIATCRHAQGSVDSRHQAAALSQPDDLLTCCLDTTVRCVPGQSCMDHLGGAVFRATGPLKMNGDTSRAMEHGCVSWRSNRNVSAISLDGTGRRTMCWSGQGHCLMDR